MQNEVDSCSDDSCDSSDSESSFTAQKIAEKCGNFGTSQDGYFTFEAPATVVRLKQVSPLLRFYNLAASSELSPAQATALKQRHAEVGERITKMQ